MIMVNENINSDEVEKLEPCNNEQSNLIQIALALMQGVSVEGRRRRDENIWSEWNEVKNTDHLTLDYRTVQYRIKQEPKATPLPIPDELWKLIKPEFKYIAMDSDYGLYLYKNEPTIFDRFWDGDDAEFASFLTVNTDGIDWRLSLTERPEGL